MLPAAENAPPALTAERELNMMDRTHNTQNLLWKLAMDRSPDRHAEKHTDGGQRACRKISDQFIKPQQKQMQNKHNTHEGWYQGSGQPALVAQLEEEQNRT
ncbi:hypothetical protein ILYODFUR_031030 [Ilyodon furcidens]|uniref:Uncharacterized protein n=1 Tax=Ilyodon furcidens TaxID=33524 RepID=A0ABV0U9Y0_9TELE